MALGVPGSLSNRPVAVAPAASAPDDGPSARKNATTRQFTYDRSITQTKRGRGRLHKLNAAVVLNTAAAPSPKTGWSTEEIANIDRILRNGLGIDAQRGDTLVVSALAFPVPQPAQPWWQERDNIVDIGTWAVYGIGALLAFMLVVRPALKIAQQHLAPASAAALTELTPVAPPAVAGPTSAQGAHAAPAPALGNSAAKTASPMPVVPLLENYDLPPPGSPVDVMVEHLKVLAGKEPERVAEVVKQWVQKNGRTE
jgi:flagellar M-ring protein FliF